MRGRTQLLCSCALAWVCVGATRPAAAQQPPRPDEGEVWDPTIAVPPTTLVPAPSPPSAVRWNDDWQRFDIGNAVVTGAGIAAAVASLAIPPTPGRWTDINELDAAVRGELRPSTLKQQNRYRDASDVLLTVAINQMLVDTLVVSWWLHERPDVAWQMALIDAEVMAINTGLNGLVAGFVSRQRPYGHECVGEDADRLEDCVRSRRYRSFFSGHTSSAFAVAGVTCMHHAYMPLYGHPVADAMFCALGFVTAAGTGTLRIVGDQHFFTDVLVGAALGSAIGLGVPWLFHYRTGAAIPSDRAAKPNPHAVGLALDLSVVPSPTGLHMVGRF